MNASAQAASYTPDTPILALADWLADPVEAASFPQAILRFRNDRAARSVGLDALDNERWVAHFGRFEPLEGNLQAPLALRYHGHQFQVYNPEIGDGRGFLFAQMRDAQGRLMDLGTKGSGQTPYSRSGDGRLTLKGAVREILATEMLEALGVYTSRSFSVIETGEQLWRDDEPSPARSAVLVRLSHGHIRIGSFQRLLALEQHDAIERLVVYCLENYPGPSAPEKAPGRDEPAVVLMHQLVERLADLAASYMVAGFAHGVLNTDNMNITGESFDYGPWRFVPRWDPAFTAAYFDRGGLYAFGRQAEAIRWNCGQFAVAMRALVPAEPLLFALDRFADLYLDALARRWCWRLGIEPRGREDDLALIAGSEQAMRDGAMGPDEFFHRYFGARVAANDPNREFADRLRAYRPREGANEGDKAEEFLARHRVESMLIDEVEEIWSAIAERDDWTPLYDKIERVRALGDALGPPPRPRGHE